MRLGRIDGRTVAILEPTDARALRPALTQWLGRHRLHNATPAAALVELATTLEQLAAIVERDSAIAAVLASEHRASPPTDAPPSFVSSGVAATVLGITPSTVRRRDRLKRIPGVCRHGRDWLVPIAYLTTKDPS